MHDLMSIDAQTWLTENTLVDWYGEFKDENDMYVPISRSDWSEEEVENTEPVSRNVDGEDITYGDEDEDGNNASET